MVPLPNLASQAGQEIYLIGKEHIPFWTTIDRCLLAETMSSLKIISFQGYKELFLFRLPHTPWVLYPWDSKSQIRLVGKA